MGFISKVKDKFVGKVAEFLTKSNSWGKLFEVGAELGLTKGSVHDPYSQVANVYKAVKAIADNVPNADLIFKDKANGEEVRDQALEDLFERPNPLMSGNDFFQAVTGFYALKGECFIIKTMSQGQAVGKGGRNLPAELWTFNPDHFQEVIEHKQLIGWKYTKTQTFYSNDEVIHLKDWNPNSLIRGLRPTDPIKNEIDIDWQSLIYNRTFFENDATPGIALKTDKTLHETQIERLRSQWRKMHQGMSKAHKMAVLDGGISIDTLGNISHRDMQFIEQKKYMREELLGIWKAPKALFNITDDLNYATFIGQMKIFWTYGIMPILKKVSAGLNAFLISPYNDRIYCEFDPSNAPAFKEDLRDKLDSAIKLKELGYTTNEINEKLGLGMPEDPRRDAILVPFNMISIDDVLNPPEPDPEPEQDPDPKDDEDDDEDDDEKKVMKEISKKNMAVWNAFVKRHTPTEIVFARAVKSYFYGQRNRVLQAVDEQFEKAVKIYCESLKWCEENRKPANHVKFSMFLNFDWNEEADLWKRKASPHIKKAAGAGSALSASLLPSELGRDVTEKIIQRVVKSRTAKSVTVVETMKARVDQAVNDGLLQGQTISEISEAIKGNIKREYNRASTRARVIARTETTSAMNGSSFEYYKEAGLDQHQWVTAGDGKERDTHIAVNGEIVNMGENFSNGLIYPGSDGPAEEVINCRCTLLPVIE